MTEEGAGKDMEDFTDLDETWSEYSLPDGYTSGYTLPDGYNPIIGVERGGTQTPASGSSPVSGSGASAATDPFEVDGPHSDLASDVGEERPVTITNTHPRKRENSAGFDFTDVDPGEGDRHNAVTITRPSSFGFTMPDMGFFGVASPPNYYKDPAWTPRDAVPQIPIYARHRLSSSSEDSSSGPQIPIIRNSGDLSEGSPRSIPNSPRWIMIDGQCFSFSHRHSIPNSPPQSPLYRRQATKQAKIFEDIHENCQLINTPARFLQSKKCYDLIPNSGKLIVFDKHLLVKKAFNALIAHGTRAAPIWDSTVQSYTGMLTITDFITILYHCYNREGKNNIDDIIENKTIEEWKIISEKSDKGLISIDPMETLFTAAKILLEKSIHRLPVIDPRSGNTLYILTHKRILNHIYPYLIESQLDPFFDLSIQDLRVGTYDNVKQLKYGSKLMEAMNFFAHTRVSAIPIVDDNKAVVDIYARFDVITLAARGKYRDMDMTIRECLKLRSTQAVEVLTCQATDSLIEVLQSVYKAQVHRLVVVDDARHVVGLVSLSDIFRFLVFRTHNFNDLEEALQDEEQHFEFG